MISTQTLVTEIPTRAMLDLEALGGEGFCAEYAVLAAVEPSPAGGLVMLVEHAGSLVALPVTDTTTVPVITYGLQHVGDAQEVSS